MTPGDTVKITAGRWAGKTGTVQAVGHESAMITVWVGGKARHPWVHADHIETIAEGGEDNGKR